MRVYLLSLYLFICRAHHESRAVSQVDQLSVRAQAALRRTMEKYSAGCRLILSCSSASKVIEPVRSRCLLIRVPAPTEQDIYTVLDKVCHAERVALPQEFGQRVAQASERNVRRALLMLEVGAAAKRVSSCTLLELPQLCSLTLLRPALLRPQASKVQAGTQGLQAGQVRETSRHCSSNTRSPPSAAVKTARWPFAHPPGGCEG